MLPKWLKQKFDSAFFDALVRAQNGGALDEVMNRRIQNTLFWVRFHNAVEPWLALVRPIKQLAKLAVEVCRGKYRRTAAKVHGSAHAAPGGGAGASATVTVQSGAITGITTSAYGAFGTVTNNSSPRPIEDAGIRAGEIVGYRCWRLLEDGMLYSVYRDEFVWKPGEVVEGDLAIYNGGIHAFKDRLAMGHYGQEHKGVRGYGSGYHGTVTIVSGTVELWGDVIEHVHGYRASRAAILSIDDSPHYDAPALRKLYKLERKRVDKRKKPA